jgi:ParB/RepB/Spo0J family partition protein
MSLQKVEINKIKVVENHRTNVNETHLDEMMQSIKQHGVLQPIGIAKDGKGGYVLRFGQRRLLACKKLGYKTIDAMVTDEKDENKLDIEGLTENIQRKDPSFAEMGRVILKLEKNGLALNEVAVRLGISLPKIKSVVEVYQSLPEKLRQKVMFMEKGGGRKARKGCIPANIAVKIVNMKKDHGLSDKSTDNLFDKVVNEEVSEKDLQNVSTLMGGGLTAEQALANAAQYGVYTVSVVVKKSDIQDLLGKHRLMNTVSLLKKAIYGEIPAIPKPPFVFTGLTLDKKIVHEQDKKPFIKIRIALMGMMRAKMLSEAQAAALKSTSGSSKDWTPEQCEQLNSIYKTVNKK